MIDGRSLHNLGQKNIESSVTIFWRVFYSLPDIDGRSYASHGNTVLKHEDF